MQALSGIRVLDRELRGHLSWLYVPRSHALTPGRLPRFVEDARVAGTLLWAPGR